MLALVACAPSVPDDDDEDASTSTSSSSDDAQDDVATETGAIDSTSGVDETSSGTEESSTGAPAPGCMDPGACDASCMQWEMIVDGVAPTSIDHVATAPDGTILTIETSESAAPGNALLRGYDATGQPSFELAVNEDAGADMVAVTALTVAEDGMIAIAWTQRVAEFHYVSTLDVRMPDGSPGWTEVLGDDGLSVVVNDVAFADDGTVVVAGGHNTSAVSYTGFASAHGPDHVVAWELGSTDLDIESGEITAISSMAAAGFVVAGYEDHALWLGRIDGDGGVAWTAAEAGDAELDHDAMDLAVTAEGDIVVVGSEAAGSSPYPVPWLGRFAAADGSLESSVAYPAIAEGPHGLDSIAITDDGRIFVAGVRVNESGGTSRHTQELDCDGAIAWEWTHENPSDYDHANGGGLDWSPDVGLVVGGSDYLGEDQNYLQRGFVALLTP